MIRLRLLVLWTMYTFIISEVHSQTGDSIIQYSIYSQAFDEERQISVCLPEQYLSNPSDSFMVTYVLDAQGPHYFNMVVSAIHYLTSRYSIIPTIVVGIHAKDRYREFTPFARPGSTNPREANFESHLLKLHQHFEKEIFPYIEAGFRTQPFRTIIGHSRGGSYVVQTLFDGHDHLFDAYLAISPGLQFDNFQTIDLAAESKSKNKALNKFLYVSVGDVGEIELFFEDHFQRLTDALKHHPDSNFIFYPQRFHGKDHFSTVLPSITEGLVHLQNEFMASTQNIFTFSKDTTQSIGDHIDAFNTDRLNRYGYVHPVSSQYILNIANGFFEMEDYSKASDLYQWADRQDGLNQWWHYLNYGRCEMDTGHQAAAIELINRGEELLKSQKAFYGDRYERIFKSFNELKQDILNPSN